MRTKRIIEIEVSVVGQDVHCEQKTMLKEMIDEDERFRKDRSARAQAAIQNASKQKAGQPLKEGDFLHVRQIHTHAAAGMHEPSHAVIHLFRSIDGPQDEIRWFTRQDIQFNVSVERNPELIRITANPPAGIDNLFDPANLAVTGDKDSPVWSGPIRDDADIMAQQYYKYTVKVEGKNAFDPDIEGHAGL